MLYSSLDVRPSGRDRKIRNVGCMDMKCQEVHMENVEEKIRQKEQEKTYGRKV